MKETLSNGHIVMWGPYTRDELDELHDMGVHSPPIRLPSLALKPSAALESGVAAQKPNSGEVVSSEEPGTDLG